MYSPSTGLFYLAGGRSVVQEAYDPDTDDWHDVTPLPRALDHIQAVEYGGLIYYIGGLVTWPGPAVGTVYVYDPVADRFTSGAPMRARDVNAAPAALRCTTARSITQAVCTTGRRCRGSTSTTRLLERWTVLPDMPRAKDHFHAAVVGDRFYAIGGRATAIVATTTANDAFDLRSGSWITTLAPLPTARGGFATAVLGARVLVIGGEGGGATFASRRGL